MKFSSIGLFALGFVGLANAACSGPYGQCGGINYAGEKCCVSGYSCKFVNDWYSQCVEGAPSTGGNVNSAANNNNNNYNNNNNNNYNNNNNNNNNYNNNNNNYNNNNNNAGSNVQAAGRIFIAGDSTVDSTMGNGGKTVGWGKFLGNYVTVPVFNHAKSGRSSRSFIREGRWDALIKDVTAGDYVFIEFGHNDGGGPTNEKERGSVVGEGNETVTVTLKSGETEVVHTFSWYLRQMANQVLAKKAHPVLLTQTPRKIFSNGKIEAPGRFHTYTKNLAKELGIPCIDMYNYIARQYETMGEAYLESNGYFPVDYLHSSPTGADLNARILVNAFSNCEKIPELAAVLNNDGKAVKLSCTK